MLSAARRMFPVNVDIDEEGAMHPRAIPLEEWSLVPHRARALQVPRPPRTRSEAAGYATPCR